jgi:hypothetical protein
MLISFKEEIVLRVERGRGVVSSCNLLLRVERP